MSAHAAGLEGRVAALEEQLAALRGRLAALEGGGPIPVGGAAGAAAPGGSPAPPAVAPAGPEAAPRWSGSSVLARMSSVSFLLVVALGLRTVADSGIISPVAGAVAGICYASALMIAGWVQYGRRSQLAPVFAICGAMLLCAIVVETHSSFGSLGAVPAYVALGAAALFMTGLGERFATPVPGTVGLLGTLAAAVGLNVPTLDLQPFALFLLAAVAMGAVISRRLRGEWLGWVTFALPAAVLFVWGVRIRVALAGTDPAGIPPGSSWFPLLVWGFSAIWVAQSLAGVLRPPRGAPSPLALFLPTLGPAASWLAGLQVAAARGDARAHGVVGFLAAGALVAIAAWAGRRSGKLRVALAAYAVAAVALFSLGFSAATGSLLGALPLLSVTAFGFAVLAVRWESGGVRLVSYSLQIFVAVALGAILVAGDEGASPALAAAASLVLLVTGLAHHRWCRRNAPPECSLAFSLLGQGDRCAVTLLTSALAGGFFLLRTGVQVAFAGRGEAFRDAFIGAQTIIINLAGILLFALAARGRSRELRSVAIFLTLIGAAKVFLYDLLALHGVARVASVFSFGVLAAVASLVLGRWQRGAAE